MRKLFKANIVLQIFVLQWFMSSINVNAQNGEKKFTYYKERSTYYLNLNLDSSRAYVDSCVLLASKMDERYFLGISFQLKGRDFIMRSLIDSALTYEKKAAEIFEYYPDSTAHFASEYNLGNIYVQQEEHIKALVQYKKVLRRIDDNFESYIKGGDAKINLNRAYCYVSIGMVYDYMRDYSAKLESLQKGLKIAYKVDTEESQILQAITLGNIGMTYFQLGDYELAESYAIAGMDQKNQLEFEYTNGYNFQVLARAAFGREKYALSLKYLEQSDLLFESIQNKSELSLNAFWRAKCFFAQKKYELALELLHPLEKTFSETNSKKELIELYDLLAEIYTVLNNYKKANEYMRIALFQRDELSYKNGKEAVEEFLTFFEDEENRIDDKLNHFNTIKEKEKLEIQVSVQKEKEIWIYSLFIVSTICFILIIVVIARGNRRNKRINQELNYSIDEKQILFKEVHHRVKNNFQIISSLLNLQQGIEENERGKKVLTDAQGRIQSMSLVHEMLYRKNEVKRIDFKSYTEELLASIIKLYSNESTKVEFEISCGNESFDLELAVPLGLMLNEAATNTVKYAFEGKTSGKISVILKPADKKNYLLIIKDNGSGIPTEFINGSKETLGIELISILSEQLGGSVQYLNENGTEVRILFNAVD